VNMESLVEIFEQETVYLNIIEEPEKIFETVSDKMKKSLSMLSSIERSVFLLRSIEQLSYKEISGVLKIPIGTVMSHLSRARVKLRRLLCDYANETGFSKK